MKTVTQGSFRRPGGRRGDVFAAFVGSGSPPMETKSQNLALTDHGIHTVAVTPLEG